MARLSLGTTAAGERAANRQFTNGALISGMVTPQGDEEIDPDEAAIIKQSIDQHMLGAENAGGIPVINRKLGFSPWSLSAADAQFIESRTFQVVEISRWLGVPPHLLSETEKATSWGAGIEAQNLGLARYTLQPWTSRLDAALSPLITNPRRCVEFDFSKFVKPSPVDETNMLNVMVNGGWMTPNEARAQRGLPPIAGGDALRIPPGAAVPPSVTPGGPIGIVGQGAA
jgi:HK97 family phage portal protein